MRVFARSVVSVSLLRKFLLSLVNSLFSGKLYNNPEYVEERHRHRYEVNPALVPNFEEKGLKFVGHDVEGERMEIMELKGMLFNFVVFDILHKVHRVLVLGAFVPVTSEKFAPELVTSKIFNAFQLVLFGIVFPLNF